MSEHQIEDRWVTKDSASRLTAVLGLASNPHMQDWEHECADPQRLGEFLDLYERGGLGDDDRFALMALIVSSFDERLGAGGADETVLRRVERILLADFRLHRRTIHYWCLLDEPDVENVFDATPFMREIWSQRK
jgi:hypothetical protein